VKPRSACRGQAARRACRAAAALLAWVLAGCTILEIRPLEPALFPPANSQPAMRDATRVRVTLSEPQQSFTSPSLSFRAAQVKLPIGAIVEAAAQLALREQFEAVPSAETTEPGLRLFVSQVTPEITSRLIYVIPVPGGVIDRVDLSSRLTFNLAVLAPDGSARWTRHYDTGLELVQIKREHLLSTESLQTAMQRSLHEQAARLMRLAAADLRTWLAQERTRERVL
jgi:hypothetical protein